VPAYGAYTFSGTIREVIPAPTAVRSPRPYLVAIDVANRDGALRPGMSAQVDLPVVTGRDALAVPNAALSSVGGTKLALVSDDHGRAEAVAVGIGVANADLTEVMGPGVAAGRVVVTDASPSTCLVTPRSRRFGAD
jgi:multidrug efflux pump subunit AcrA (membrane-fusion protein)